MGGLGAADRRGQAPREGAAEGAAAEDLGDPLAAPERAKWRGIQAELGPWRLAAQLFLCWSKQGVWALLLELVQQRGSLALGAFTSVQDLERAILAYVAETNADPKPFVWTKTAEEILAGVARFCQRTSNSGY